MLDRSPGSADWASKREDLEEQVADHREKVMSLFPYLSEEIELGTVAIGSGYDLENNTDPDWKKFSRQELELRVGVGHELVQEMRSVSSMAYQLQVYQRPETEGVIRMQQVAQAQKRVSTRMGKVAADYNHNWSKIKALIDCSGIPPSESQALLRGLQVLDRKTDFKYFISPGAQTESYMGHLTADATWIWKVQMLGKAASAEPADMRAALKNWERECAFIVLLASVENLTCPAARRLRWVHAFAALERWKEEVIRTEEEIRRLGAWYDHQTRAFQNRDSVPAKDNTWAMRGLHAIQQELARKWQSRQARLPPKVRRGVATGFEAPTLLT
jgi:hypothetical protein